MQISKEADFLLKGNKVIYPPVRTDGLELYYDVKGKKNSDLYKNKLLDMSGNGRHGELHDFNYKNLSGYQEDSQLVFDDIDDTLTMPELNGIDANNFTYQLNNNILAFTGDEVKTVKNGDVEVGGRNLIKDSQHVRTYPNNTGLGIATLMSDENEPYYTVVATGSYVSIYGFDGSFDASRFSEPMVDGATYTVVAMCLISSDLFIDRYLYIVSVLRLS